MTPILPPNPTTRNDETDRSVLVEKHHFCEASRRVRLAHYGRFMGPGAFLGSAATSARAGVIAFLIRR